MNTIQNRRVHIPLSLQRKAGKVRMGAVKPYAFNRPSPMLDQYTPHCHRLMETIKQEKGFFYMLPPVLLLIMIIWLACGLYSQQHNELLTNTATIESVSAAIRFFSLPAG